MQWLHQTLAILTERYLAIYSVNKRPRYVTCTRMCVYRHVERSWLQDSHGRDTDCHAVVHLRLGEGGAAHATTASSADARHSQEEHMNTVHHYKHVHSYMYVYVYVTRLRISIEHTALFFTTHTFFSHHNSSPTIV